MRIRISWGPRNMVIQKSSPCEVTLTLPSPAYMGNFDSLNSPLWIQICVNLLPITMVSGLILGCRDHIWRTWLGHIGTSTRVLLSNHPLPYLGESEPHGCSEWQLSTAKGERKLLGTEQMLQHLTTWNPIFLNESDQEVKERCLKHARKFASGKQSDLSDPPTGHEYLDLIPLTSTYIHTNHHY